MICEDLSLFPLHSLGVFARWVVSDLQFETT